MKYIDLHTQFVCPHRRTKAFDGANAAIFYSRCLAVW